MDRTSHETSGTYDASTNADGNGSHLPPVVYVAKRNEDGEGDGRRLAAAIDMMEAHANGDNVIAVSGLRVAEIASARNLRGRERATRTAALAIPTGHITLRHHVPDLLN